MADRENPFPGAIELPDDFEQQPIVAKILRRPPSQNEDCLVIRNLHVVKCHIRVETVSGPLHVGVPARFEVVHNEVQAPPRWSRNHCVPCSLPETVYGIKRFIGFPGVAGNHKYFAHGGYSNISESIRPAHHRDYRWYRAGRINTWCVPFWFSLPSQLVLPPGKSPLR